MCNYLPTLCPHELCLNEGHTVTHCTLSKGPHLPMY